ncbi:protein VACUOLELESS1 [Histomonas meleagridis]|uniref:protein VACUOLELESS1 n=1 Tax=Histomonas meleagridis TaxID=135588 RepID=UPI003559B3A0|nr:protein VACUOLELESS1 [Histomonas meleagridis]KAH0802917.1 protein VACUOLELESS1 [Histomonas meleagridis]
MQELIGENPPTLESFSKIRESWDSTSELEYSWKNVWERQNYNELTPSFEIISGGVNGNLIAYHRPDFVRESNRKRVTVHDYKMNEIYTYIIASKCDDIFFYMSQSDHLIVLTNRGVLLKFFGGRLINQYPLTSSIILKADIWENGLVFLTDQKELYYAPFYDNPTLLNSFTEEDGVNVFKVIPAEYTSDGLPIVLLNFFESTYILAITSTVCSPIEVNEKVKSFAFSSDYSLVSILTEEGTLIIAPSSFENVILRTCVVIGEFNQIAWLGKHVPVISYDNRVGMVTATGDFIELEKGNYTGTPVLLPSEEYMLVLSNESLFKLNIVSSQLHDTAVPTVDTPSSRLIDAFDKRSTALVMKLKDENLLEGAVEECINAALEVDEVQHQTMLMLSAIFGRSFLHEIDTSKFPNISKTLRICNSFKEELNTFITPLDITQHVSQNDLLMRICGRNRFTLAVNIADYLGLDKQPILTQWACAVANKFDDDEAFNIIQKKMDASFDFTSIAIGLRLEGRKELSLRISKLEKNHARIVPFLISSGQWQNAINAAVLSSDSSLFIDVINQAIKNNQDDNLIGSAIASDFVSFSTIAKLVGNRRDTKISEILVSTPLSSQSVETVVCGLIKKKLCKNPSLGSINEFIGNLDDISYQFKDTKWIENQKNIASYQKNFILKLNEQRPEDLKISLNSHLRNLILKKDFQKAEALVDKTKMKKERFYVMIAQTFASNDRWDDFVALSDEKFKSCYQYFIAICSVKWGQDKAMEFARNLRDQKAANEYTQKVEKDPRFLANVFESGSMQLFKSKLF